MSEDNLSRRGLLRHLAVWSLVGIAATVVGVHYVQDPSPRHQLALSAFVAGLDVLIGLGPLLRGARPFSLWSAVTAGAGCFLVAVMLRPEALVTTHRGLADVFYLGGYLAFSAWFLGVARRIGGVAIGRAVLDVLIASTSTVLVLWACPVAHPPQHDLVTALRWTAYPILDAVALSLAGMLAIRLGSVVRAWWWVTAAIAVQLGIDMVDSLAGADISHSYTALLSALTLVPFFLLAVGATHPSVVHLSTTRLTPRASRGRPGRRSLVYVGVVPAVASLGLPPREPIDLVVRAILATVLVALLVARQLATIRELTRAEAASHHRATHDTLTGLLNRSALFDAIRERLADDADAGRHTALLFLDCDHFKRVNDTWGHPAGDALLRGIADGLPRRLRPDDVLARHGGDEFVIVASLDRPEDAEGVARRVLDFFDEPSGTLPDTSYRVTPSIGVAVTGPTDQPAPVELLAHADVALYEAKNRGRATWALYDDELAGTSTTRAALADALRAAVRQRRIHVEFQPIHRCDDDALVGWEALARWDDPVLGRVGPDVFIPLAEDLGLVCELGAHVLDEACAALARLHAVPHLRHTSVSVNVSALQLQHPEFARGVARALTAHGLQPESLRLEVTESLFVDDCSPALATLHEVRGAGVRIGIDDFGTGYASLATLLRLPLDFVKIDRCITRRLGEHDDAVPQVRAVVDLVRSLHIEGVVAEGVETAEQAAALRRIGCPMAQGWWFGRPAPPEELLPDLRAAG